MYVPQSYTYLTLIDYNERPKYMLASFAGASFSVFYNTYEYSVVPSCILTFLFLELFIRCLMCIGCVVFVMYVSLR